MGGLFCWNGKCGGFLQSHSGVKGLVYDLVTGDPIVNAIIAVRNQTNGERIAHNTTSSKGRFATSWSSKGHYATSWSSKGRFAKSLLTKSTNYSTNYIILYIHQPILCIVNQRLIM